MNLETDVVSVYYKVDGNNYKRQYFSSAVEQIIIIRITADKPGSISFNARLRRGRYLDIVNKISYNAIMMKGMSGSDEGISTIGESIIVKETSLTINKLLYKWDISTLSIFTGISRNL